MIQDILGRTVRAIGASIIGFLDSSCVHLYRRWSRPFEVSRQVLSHCQSYSASQSLLATISNLTLSAH
jgi:hypothetical protein